MRAHVVVIGAAHGAFLAQLDAQVDHLVAQIVELRLSGDLSSATIVRRIGDNAFEVPTTVARWGNRLATVNAKFDTGFPPSATTFEVVEVNAR